MLVRLQSLLSCLAITAIALSGCASTEPDATPSGASDAQEQDLVSRGGVTLTAPSDSGLKISLMMLNGVQPRTKNMRFIKATVYRRGKSFGAFCTLLGTVTSAADQTAK